MAIDKAVLTTIAQAMISNRMRLLECFITADKISPFIACNWMKKGFSFLLNRNLVLSKRLVCYRRGKFKQQGEVKEIIFPAKWEQHKTGEKINNFIYKYI